MRPRLPPELDNRVARVNGFARPWHSLQLLSWIVFAIFICGFYVFFGTAFPVRTTSSRTRPVHRSIDTNDCGCRRWRCGGWGGGQQTTMIALDVVYTALTGVVVFTWHKATACNAVDL